MGDPGQASDSIGSRTLSDAQLRRSVWVSALMALLLPPFIGGTLMGFAGYYPLPEFYLVFVSFTGAYVAMVVGGSLLYARRFASRLIRLGQLDGEELQQKTRRLFARLPWTLLCFLTLYSMVGAFSADLSLQRLGHRQYTPSDHLNNQIGLVPVVLITALPIFFYFTDRLGRYFGPRGVHAVIVPLSAKFALLGIVTPLLIDSVLVGYFVNQTGRFEPRLMMIWAGLLALAGGSTWLAWRSLRQGLQPLQAVLHEQAAVLDSSALAQLRPQSIDELGVLTHRLAVQIQRQERLSAELDRTRALSQTVLDHAGALVIVLDRQGHIVRFNQACESLSGYRAHEAIGRYPWDLLLPPEQAESVRHNAFEALANQPAALSGRYTNEWLCRDGSRVLLDWFNTLLLDEQGKTEFMVSIGIDITQRQRMEEALRQSESKYRRLHESMTDAYVQSDIQGRLLEWNPAYQTMLGYANDELARLHYTELTPARWHESEARIVAEQVFARGYSDVYEKEYRRKDGTVFPVEMRTYLLHDDDGTPVGMWAIVRDISERKANEARIASLAYYDVLTGLPNRTLFFDRLQTALAKARRDSLRAALLFIDLDRFKPVNDTYGHEVGDQLLQRVAQQLRDCVRESDTVARLGGDEFVVLLPQVHTLDDALAVAEKIHARLREPVEIGDYRLEISSAIGVATFPEDGADEVALVRSADDAMYRAKAGGRDQVIAARIA